MRKIIAFGGRGRVRGDHQGPPFTFNNPPAGDKLPKAILALGNLLGGVAFCNTPSAYLRFFFFSCQRSRHRIPAQTAVTFQPREKAGLR